MAINLQWTHWSKTSNIKPKNKLLGTRVRHGDLPRAADSESLARRWNGHTVDRRCAGVLLAPLHPQRRGHQFPQKNQVTEEEAVTQRRDLVAVRDMGQGQATATQHPDSIPARGSFLFGP